MPFFLFTTSPQNFSKWIPEANSVRPSTEKKIASELQMVYPVVQMEFTVKMDKNI